MRLEFRKYLERLKKMKTSSEYLKEASALVQKIDVELGIERHKLGKAVFIDVRDSADIASTGTIEGALKIPRGFIEFAADESTPFHNKALSKDQEIILVCGAGGMAALTGKTMIEMGYKNIKNVGGIGDWIKAEGPLEK